MWREGQWESILAGEGSLCEGHKVGERATVARAQGHEVTLGCNPSSYGILQSRSILEKTRRPCSHQWKGN